MKQKFTYAEQLNHPLWKEKARWIRERDDFRCVKCGIEWKLLHIHHTFYDPSKLAWEYSDESLKTLFEDCHAWETMYERIFYRLTYGLGGWICIGQRLEFDRIKSFSKVEAFIVFEEMVKKNPLNDLPLLEKLASLVREMQESKSHLTNPS